MADNIAITAGSGTTVATDDVGGVHHPYVKVEYGAADSATPVSTTNPLPVLSPTGVFTCSTDVTRPADTTAYAANDALSNSTSAPTSGGFTFSNAARASGGSGIILGATFATSNDPGTALQGELFIFDQSVTNINDNSAFAVSDSEIKTCVAKIPFVLEDVGNNDFFNAQGLYIPFTCSGSADLRFLVRVKNAYTPANAEVLTFVIRGIYTT